MKGAARRLTWLEKRNGAVVGRGDAIKLVQRIKWEPDCHLLVSDAFVFELERE